MIRLLVQIALRKLRLCRGGRSIVTKAPEGGISYHVCPIGHVTDYLSVPQKGKIVACYCPTCTLEYPV